MASTRSKYVRADTENAAPDFQGDNRDQRGYLAWCAVWLSECRRVLRPGGHLLMCSDWRQLPVATDAVQAGGLVWRGILNWHKPAHQRVGQVSYACEYLVYATNGPVVPGPRIPGIYSESAPHSSKRDHQTEKPAGLVRHCFGLLSGPSVVVDPFAGSGVVGEVAQEMGHTYRGCEISEHFAEVARRRLGLTGAAE